MMHDLRLGLARGLLHLGLTRGLLHLGNRDKRRRASIHGQLHPIAGRHDAA